MSLILKKPLFIGALIASVFVSSGLTYLFAKQQHEIVELQYKLKLKELNIAGTHSPIQTEMAISPKKRNKTNLEQSKSVERRADAVESAATEAELDNTLYRDGNMSILERLRQANTESPQTSIQNPSNRQITKPPQIHHEMIEDNAPIYADNMFYGSEDARFIIEAYSDVECPFCRKSHFALKQVVNYKPELVGIEYKHFPLASHNPASAIQGAIIECTFAEKGNQYAWLMLDEMVKHTKGGGKGQVDYAEFADHLRVDPSWLESCVANETYQQNVKADYQAGLSLGIKATPTYFITDRKTGKRKMVEGGQSAESMAKALFDFAEQQPFR